MGDIVQHRGLAHASGADQGDALHVAEQAQCTVYLLGTPIEVVWIADGAAMPVGVVKFHHVTSSTTALSGLKRSIQRRIRSSLKM